MAFDGTKPNSLEVVDSARRFASACACKCHMVLLLSAKHGGARAVAGEACMLLRGWDENIKIDGHLNRASEDQPSDSNPCLTWLSGKGLRGQIRRSGMVE